MPTRLKDGNTRAAGSGAGGVRVGGWGGVNGEEKKEAEVTINEAEGSREGEEKPWATTRRTERKERNMPN